MVQLIESTGEVLRNSRFLRRALMIACPVVLQGVLNTVVSPVDTLMIGTMGATAVVAVGLANKLFLAFSLLVFGIASRSGILAAQFWGNGNLKNIRKVLGFSILLTLTRTLLFVVPALISPQSIMRVFTTNHDSMELGAKYLKTAVLAYPSLTVTDVYVVILRVVNKVIFPVISSYVATLISICLSYVLIFGRSGAPAMGVSGAAVATLITRTIEIALILGYVYGKGLPVACGPRELFSQSGLFISQFFRTSVPVIANEFIWGLGITMYSLAYGRMGDEAVAAITIATAIQGILVALFQDLSAATAVILDNELGTGHLKRAEKYAVHFSILQFIATVGAAVVLIGTRWLIISLYNITPEMARNVSLCILIFAVYMPAKVSNHVNVMGALRSGGDTRMCLFLDTSDVWFIGIPLAFLGALIWRLPIYTVYTLIMAEEVYRTVLRYIRYGQKKWLRNPAAEVR